MTHVKMAALIMSKALGFPLYRPHVHAQDTFPKWYLPYGHAMEPEVMSVFGAPGSGAILPCRQAELGQALGQP